MFCKNCGFELQEDAKFCSRCGTEVDFVAANKNTEPVYGTVTDPYGTYTYAQNQEEVEEKSELGGSVLKFGILGLVFSLTGILSLLGLIFSSVALSKANAFARIFGQTEGKATVGRKLGKAGLIVSIVLVSYFALCLILALASSL